MNESIMFFGGTVLGWFLKLIADQFSASRHYDHRFRLEKEYERYCDLWDDLFELRRSVVQLVDSLGDTSDQPHSDQAIPLFNEFQQSVHKGGPFMSESVNVPARNMATTVRKLCKNFGKQKALEARRTEDVKFEKDEAIAERLWQLDEENTAALEDIERLYKDVSQAIRNRVTPRPLRKFWVGKQNQSN
jgi:hypothetical protein